MAAPWDFTISLLFFLDLPVISDSNLNSYELLVISISHMWYQLTNYYYFGLDFEDVVYVACSIQNHGRTGTFCGWCKSNVYAILNTGSLKISVDLSLKPRLLNFPFGQYSFFTSLMTLGGMITAALSGKIAALTGRRQVINFPWYLYFFFLTKDTFILTS